MIKNILIIVSMIIIILIIKRLDKNPNQNIKKYIEKNTKHIKIYGKFNDLVEYSIKVSKNYINNKRLVFGFFNRSYLDNSIIKKKLYFDKIMSILKDNNVCDEFIQFFIDNKKLIEEKKLAYTGIGRDFKENASKFYLEYKIDNTTYIKCIEKHKNNAILYKNYTKIVVPIKDVLDELLTNFSKKNDIIDLFENDEADIYKCYISHDKSFKNSTLYSIHIRTFDNLNELVSLIKGLYEHINGNLNRFSEFVGHFADDLFVNYISISYINNKVSFSVYGDKSFI